MTTALGLAKYTILLMAFSSFWWSLIDSDLRIIHIFFPVPSNLNKRGFTVLANFVVFAKDFQSGHYTLSLLILGKLGSAPPSLGET